MRCRTQFRSSLRDASVLARAILDAEQLSWVDASGRGHLVVPGRIYITRIEPIRADAGRTFKWSASADAIAETLLTWQARQPFEPTTPIARVAAIVKATDVSPAHAARVLRQFDEQRYTAKTGAERGSSATREFRDPGRMLSDWAGHYAASAGAGPAAEFHVPWCEIEQSISMLVRALEGSNWALTGGAAADRIAPHLTNVPTLEFYVSVENLSVVRRQLSIGTVSPVRAYADLLRHRGRSAEAAEYLREVAIGF